MTFASRFFRRGFPPSYTRWDNDGGAGGMNDTLRIIEDFLAPRIVGVAVAAPAFTEHGDVTIDPASGRFWICNFDESGASTVDAYLGASFKGHVIPAKDNTGVWQIDAAGAAWIFREWGAGAGGITIVNNNCCPPTCGLANPPLAAAFGLAKLYVNSNTGQMWALCGTQVVAIAGSGNGGGTLGVPTLGAPSVNVNAVTVPIDNCESGAIVTVTQQPGGATRTALCSGAQSVQFTGLPNGNYSYTATQNDGVNTSGTSNTVAATVNVAPGVFAATCAPVTNITATTAISHFLVTNSASLPAGWIMQQRWATSVFGPWNPSSPPQLPVVDGDFAQSLTGLPSGTNGIVVRFDVYDPGNLATIGQTFGDCLFDTAAGAPGGGALQSQASAYVLNSLTPQNIRVMEGPAPTWGIAYPEIILSVNSGYTDQQWKKFIYNSSVGAPTKNDTAFRVLPWHLFAHRATAAWGSPQPENAAHSRVAIYLRNYVGGLLFSDTGWQPIVAQGPFAQDMVNDLGDSTYAVNYTFPVNDRFTSTDGVAGVRLVNTNGVSGVSNVRLIHNGWAHGLEYVDGARLPFLRAIFTRFQGKIEFIPGVGSAADVTAAETYAQSGSDNYPIGINKGACQAPDCGPDWNSPSSNGAWVKLNGTWQEVFSLNYDRAQANPLIANPLPAWLKVGSA